LAMARWPLQRFSAPNKLSDVFGKHLVGNDQWITSAFASLLHLFYFALRCIDDARSTNSSNQ